MERKIAGIPVVLIVHVLLLAVFVLGGVKLMLLGVDSKLESLHQEVGFYQKAVMESSNPSPTPAVSPSPVKEKPVATRSGTLQVK